jgi:predicted MFS family arabinose efflux permease
MTRSSSAASVALGGLIALAVAMGIGRFVYTPILPFMAEDLGLTQSQGGVIASANLLGYLVGALGAAITGLPGGRRGWFFAALAISALTTGAMGATSSMTMFLALRVIGGAASAFVMVFGSAIVLDRLAAAGQAGLSAVHFAGVGVGIAVSALVVSGLAAADFGWRAHWLLSGGISLFALAAVVWLIPGGRSDEWPAAAAPGGAIDRRLIALTIAYGLFGFGYMITATFISTMVRLSPDIHSLEPVIWLVVGLSSIPSVALWAWVGRRWGNGRSFAWACLVEGVGVGLSVFATGAVTMVAAAVLFGGTVTGIVALGLIHGRSLSAGDPRRTIALMTAVFGLGQVIGPTFAGVAFDYTGSFMAPSLAAAAALFMAAGLVGVRSSSHSP